MYHYQFNIGDYKKDTAHLSILEHGIYRMLIDSYYTNEGPLPADDAKLMRTHCIRTAEEQQAYKNVVSDFFELRDGAYFHAGCEKVMGKIYEKSSKARESAAKRWANKNKGSSPAKCEPDANALRTDSEGNANGMLPETRNPIPNTHKTTNPWPGLKSLDGIDFSAWPSLPTKETMQQWLKVRKSKKATNSQIAMDDICAQVVEANTEGIDAERCIRYAVAKSWSGFKLAWMKSEEQGNAGNQRITGQAPSKSERATQAHREYIAQLEREAADADGGRVAGAAGAQVGH